VRHRGTTVLSVGMKCDPLPLTDCFPSRILTAGFYGYIFTTKWLTEIERGPSDGGAS